LVTTTGIFLALSAVAGVIVVYFRGAVPLYIALVGAVLGNSYSGRPFRLGYHGYGELLIGLMFGPLLMMGVQYAACGHLGGGIVVIGIAVGFLVTNILYTHSVLDAQADARLDKITLAGLLKGPKALLTASAVFEFVPFVLVALGVWRGLLPPASLCVLIVLPMAVYLWRSLYRFVYGKPEAILLKKWLGPMGDFPAYRAAGIDWFMYRWLMARNLVSFFTLILLIVHIVLKITTCL
ncbi:MAG: prenyltransferase, partial [Porphyromonadaceae bacterium]|nr:prenyltransferase [Porphyromonadaceae bacterium]